MGLGAWGRLEWGWVRRGWHLSEHSGINCKGLFAVSGSRRGHGQGSDGESVGRAHSCVGDLGYLSPHPLPR